MTRLKLHWQILIALICAVIAGMAISAFRDVAGVSTLYATMKLIGAMFLNALKMVVVPLVVASIICGVMNLATEGGNAGRLGRRTISYYLVTSAIAITVGLLAVNIVQPGIVDGKPGSSILGLDNPPAEKMEELQAKTKDKDASDFAEVILRMLPPNIFAAAADNGQLLGVIVFALFFGFFITKLPSNLREPQMNFWNGVQHIMMGITEFIMKFAPIGVFGLVTKVVADSPDFVGMLGVLSTFAFTVLLALAVHLFIVLPMLLAFVGRVSPLAHFRAMSTPLLTAFSTASSSATLPLTIDAVTDNAGVSRRTASFVLPLGATMNMDGTALYECVVVIFIAQAMGVDLSIAEQIMIVTMALLTSIGVAGIPSASLVAITLIVTSVGIPGGLEAVAVIMIVDRVLDMCRTAVNVFSDSCGAVLIAKGEGETGILEKG